MLTPSWAKWVYWSVGGETPVPLNDPSVATEKSYPAVLTPPMKAIELVEVEVGAELDDEGEVGVLEAVPGRHLGKED